MHRYLTFILALVLGGNMNAQSFNNTQKLVASDRSGSTNQYAGYGAEIIIQNGVLAVSEPYEEKDINGNNQLPYAGAVYIYELDSNSDWHEVQKIVEPVRHSGDNFGASIVFFEDKLLIGSLYNSYDANDSNYLASAGAVYSYEQDSTGAWVLHQKIVASNRAIAGSCGFGRSLFTNSNSLFIGSGNGYDSNNQNYQHAAGSIYSFELDSIGDWNEVQIIVPSARNGYDYFGMSFSASDSILIAGASGHDYDENNSSFLQNAGAVFVFKKDSVGTWIEDEKIVQQPRVGNAYFGNGIEESENFLVISYYTSYENQFVDLYYMSSSQYSLIQTLGINNAAYGYSGLQFGRASLFVGDTLFIAAPGYYSAGQTSGGIGGGIIQQYIFTSADTFVLQSSIESCSNEDSVGLAFSLAYASGQLFAGVPHANLDANGANYIAKTGAVIVFETCVQAQIDSLSNDSMLLCQGGSGMIEVFGYLPSGVSWGLFSSDSTGTLIDSNTSGEFTLYGDSNAVYFIRPMGGCEDACSESSYISVTIQEPSVTNVNVEACDSMFVAGQWVFSNDTLVDTLQSSLGCDSVVVYSISILSHPVSYMSVVDCDSTFIAGQWIFVSDSLSDTIQSTLGCDSIVIYAITIHESQFGIDTIIGVDSVVFNSYVIYESIMVDSTYSGASANGCDSTVTYVILVNPPLEMRAVTTNETYGLDGTIDLILESGTPPYRIDWDNDGLGDWDDTEDLNDLAAGVYTVYVEDATGQNESLVVEVLDALGTSESSSALFNVYPNPTKSSITVDAPFEIEAVNVYDMLGSFVKTKIDISNGSQAMVDLSDLPKGTYFLQVVTNDKIEEFIRVVRQ